MPFSGFPFRLLLMATTFRCPFRIFGLGFRTSTLPSDLRSSTLPSDLRFRFWDSAFASRHIPRRTLRHFFLPSAPRRQHRHFHREVCQTRQIYIAVGIFISSCFFVLRHHFASRHFYPEVTRNNSESRRKKTPNLGGKKWN